MNIFIAGLGVIGASYAQNLHTLGHRVFGYDPFTEAMHSLENHGILKASTPRAMRECDLVILAMPPRLMVPFVRTHAQHLTTGTILTDVAGVKEKTIEEINTVVPKGVHYISHHPMAGKEQSGYAARDARMFDGKNVIMIDEGDIDLSSAQILKSVLLAMGFKAPVWLSASAHDDEIAHTSQIPHLLACALVEGADASTPQAAGNSFYELTRIANINAELWSTLFVDNTTALRERLRAMRDALDRVDALLERGDEHALSNYLKSIKNKKQSF